MPKHAYKKKKLHAKSLERIARCNEIIDVYLRQGYVLSLRQLFYQGVARSFIQNSEREYKNLGNLVRDGRLCGKIDWDCIVDRTRHCESLQHWCDPADIIASFADYFSMDRWTGQTYRPEVWIEKEALSGVIRPVCERLDVPYLACKGYLSASEIWAAKERFTSVMQHGQIPIVLYRGDHDPSGVHITADIAERLSEVECPIEVRRLGLNIAQVRAYALPPNPAKRTDRRAKTYFREFGAECWELDALEPAVISGLIESAVRSLIEEEKWQAIESEEQAHRATLRVLAENWA